MTTKTTRRAILAGIATATAAPALAASSAQPIGPNDRLILAWESEANRLIGIGNGLPDELYDEEIIEQRYFVPASDLQRRILTTPCDGIEGMAAKVRLLCKLRYEYDGRPVPSAGADEHPQSLQDHAMASLHLDARRLIGEA